MADENLYEELKDALKEFKTFLDLKADIIRPAIQALIAQIKKLGEVIDLLVELMNDIKSEIEALDLGGLEDLLGDVSEFTKQVSNFLDAAADLLPEGSGDTVGDIRSALNVAGSLPSFDQVKGEITKLVDDIVKILNSFKPQPA